MPKNKMWALLPPWFAVEGYTMIKPERPILIEPSTNLAFEKVPKELFAHLDKLQKPPSFNLNIIIASKWAITCEFEGNDEHKKEALESIEALGTLVRIITPQKFFWHSILIPKDLFKPFRIPSIVEYQRDSDRSRIDLEEIPTLCDIYPFFKTKYHRAKISRSKVFNSIAFLNAALYEYDLIQQILLITSLECLFNDDGEKIAKKLAHRTTAALDEDRQIFDEIKTAYKTRCDIVHGNLVETGVPIIDLLNQCSYLRQHLCGVLQKLITEVKPDSVWWDRNKYKKWLETLDKKRVVATKQSN
ncbi:hypothetical protein JXM67_08730 [candidate division WOR-3 bacterium]|nr:hypothetical protein [candidate division WOR-3 bacterium]